MKENSIRKLLDKVDFRRLDCKMQEQRIVVKDSLFKPNEGMTRNSGKSVPTINPIVVLFVSPKTVCW